MMLITSKDALDMLATCAPRAWCKRLLNWEVFWGGLDLYARDGEIIHRRPAFEILREAGFISEPGETPAEEQLAALPDDDDETKAILNAAAATSRFESVDCAWYHWGVSDGALPIGIIVAQTHLNWETGDLTAELFDGLVPKEWLETGEGTFDAGAMSEVRVELSGLSFELSAIEMLVPTAELPRFDANETPAPPRRPGRPKKWDWEGVMAAVVAEANRNPDGLPQGYGAQAQIEKMMSDWFIARTGESPAESEVRSRASKIVTEIEGRKPKF